MVLAWDIHSRLSYAILISPYTHQSAGLFQNALKLLFGILLVGAFFGNANNSSGHVNIVSGILGSPETPDPGPFSYS